MSNLKQCVIHMTETQFTFGAGQDVSTIAARARGISHKCVGFIV